jgi:probable rRNA maturation factor
VILNRQRRVPVSLRSLERFWQRVRTTLRLPEDSVTICLVSEAAIAGWNRAYRGKSGPTDVLSFPAEEEAGAQPRPARNGAPKTGGGRAARRRAASAEAAVEPGRYLGDIAIAPAVARRNARRLGRTLEQELRILILHGALHLLGYDHETDRGEMERLEQRLRRRLGLGGR